MSSNNLARQIADVAKSKISLTEAIHELELSKEAFASISSLSSQIQQHNYSLQEVKSRLEYFVSSTYFNSKLEELAHTLDKSIKNRVDELSVSVLSKLNNKLTVEDAEILLNKRVSWSNFTVLSQEVGMMRTRMEKHILSDFEGLKTKIKLELANNVTSKKPQEQGTTEEFTQMKMKIATLEDQIQQLFNDDLVDEDYDSKEELDNIMDDLERTVLKDRKSIGEFPSAEGEILVVEGEKESLKNDGALVEAKAVNRPEEEAKTKPVLEFEISKLNNPVTNTNSPKNIASSRGESRSLVRKNSRTSSLASGAMAGASAAIRNLNKKFDILKKEVDDNKLEFLSFKQETLRFDDEICEIRESLNLFQQKQTDFAGQIEVMQSSFLRALRRSGQTKEKPEKNQQTSGKTQVSTKGLESISKELNEKFKKMVTFEANLQQVASEFSVVKGFFKEKLKEISDGHMGTKETVAGIKRELETLKKKEGSVEKWVSDKIDKVYAQICEVKGPLTSIVSDQVRESSSLQEELRRNQEVFRSLIEDYNIRPVSQLTHRKSESLSKQQGHSRVNSATPTLSMKHRYYKSNKNNEVSTIEDNWLGAVPDGKAIWLPRMSYSVSKPEKEPKSPEKPKKTK